MPGWALIGNDQDTSRLPPIHNFRIYLGVLTLVAVLLTHMLQRRSVKEEAVLRRSEIVYEKQLEVFEEAVKNLAVTNEQWRELFRLSVSEGELGALMTSSEEFKRTVLESLELKAKMSTYLPAETGAAWVVYNLEALEISREVTSTLQDGGRVDMKVVGDRLDDAYSSAVMKMREHLGIKERL